MKTMATAIVLAAISIGAPANTTTPETANATVDATATTNSSTVTPPPSKRRDGPSFAVTRTAAKIAGFQLRLTNPDCLRQVGRKSVKLHGLFTLGAKALIASPGETCDCESSCIDGIPGEQETCINLEEYPAHSFRFIKGSCPEITC